MNAPGQFCIAPFGAAAIMAIYLGILFGHIACGGWMEWLWARDRRLPTWVVVGWLIGTLVIVPMDWILYVSGTASWRLPYCPRERRALPLHRMRRRRHRCGGQGELSGPRWCSDVILSPDGQQLAIASTGETGRSSPT